MTGVTITEFDLYQVKFSSALGNGVAIWKGNELQLGNYYHVEFDIDDCFEWGVNIDSTNKEVSSVEVIDDSLVFVAKIISYEDDGILTVSFGGDIIFLELSVSPALGKYVCFSTLITNVSLYPVDI